MEREDDETKRRSPEAKACREWRDLLLARTIASDMSALPVALAAHLEQCSTCRLYAQDLNSVTAGLKTLGTLPVEPSPSLRSRWVAAVWEQREAHRTGALWKEWLELVRLAFLRNLKPLAAIAPLWVLSLGFWLTAPTSTDTTASTPARSPVEIVRLLESERPSFAARSQSRVANESGPTNRATALPRSDRFQRKNSPLAEGLDDENQPVLADLWDQQSSSVATT